MKIIWVAGARPNFMKIAPIWRAMEAYNATVAAGRPKFEPLLVHTGQHFDANMSGVFFRDLKLPEPHFHLGVGGGSHAEQVARLLVAFEELLGKERPGLVGVVGDVNSTCACALATKKAYVLPGGQTPLLVHVEAGLRSGDRLMPEEINRVVTDALADVLFTTEMIGVTTLRKEGVEASKIHFVGNVMIDSLLTMIGASDDDAASTHPPLESCQAPAGDYGVVTLHRPSNVDDPLRLHRIVDELVKIGARLPVLFPVHPRTRKVLGDSGVDPAAGDAAESGACGLRLLPPLGYRDFIALVRKAKFVITDSGGIQGETTALGVPCLTLRNTTESPVTVEVGSNKLLGNDPSVLLPEVELVLSGRGKVGTIPPLWDGHAAERIVSILAAGPWSGS